jgi:ribosomal protein L7/L12
METIFTVIFLILALTIVAVLFSRPEPGSKKPIQLSDRVMEMAADPFRRSEAVKCCREETGASKSDALLAVELIVAATHSKEVKAIAAQPGRKIEAIKLLREETGISLKAAKMAVEKFVSGPGS